MIYLPNELLKTIFDYFNMFDEIAYSQISTENYRLLKLAIHTRIVNLKTIQRFYKNHRTRFPFEESYMNIYFEPGKKRKQFITRTYIAKYPLLLIYSFPEYLVKKISIYNPEEKNKFLTKYLEKMPKEQWRTRRDIFNFLNLKCITVRDIVYTGW